jgi:hypothetical protein
VCSRHEAGEATLSRQMPEPQRTALRCRYRRAVLSAKAQISKRSMMVATPERPPASQPNN